MSIRFSSPPRPVALSLHTLTSDFVIFDGYAVYIPYYFAIAAGVTIEIGADSDLEIG